MKSISDYENINTVNPLYLIIGEADFVPTFHERNLRGKFLTLL